MSGASFQELFLLIAIGLVVLGPKRLPQVANQIGSWVGQARRMTRMMKRQLEDEINMDLDSFNVQKQLGLDESSRTPAATGKPTKPWTHEQATRAAAAGSTAATAAAAESDTARELASGTTDESHEELPDDYSPAHAAHEVGTGVDDELPDDYSPAHGADDVGTGVGDEPMDGRMADSDYIDDVELDETQAAANNDAEPPEKKQETA